VLHIPKAPGGSAATDPACQVEKHAQAAEVPVVRVLRAGERTREDADAEDAAARADATCDADATPRQVLRQPLRPSRLYNALADVLSTGAEAVEEPIAASGWRADALDESEPLASAHPLRILVVEDNPVNQRVTERMLSRLGYTATVVETGKEALAAVEGDGRRGDGEHAPAFDLVLMDLHMPEMDGLEAMQHLVDRWGERRPYVVALTAGVLDETRRRCREAGMDDFLGKPVRIGDLVPKLEAVAKQKAERDRRAAPAPPQPHAAEATDAEASAAEASAAEATAAEASAAEASTTEAERPAAPSDSASKDDEAAATDAVTINGEERTLVDREELRQNARDFGAESLDDPFVREIATTFYEDAAESIEALGEALTEDDIARAGEVAHRMKGSSATLGAMALTELCRTVEEAADDGEADVVRQAAEQIAPLFERTRDALRAVLGSAASDRRADGSAWPSAVA